MQALTLYTEAFWRNPWDCTVYVALREKGLDFHRAISMYREGIGVVDALHAYSITGTAPVLQHGSFWLAESQAIVEYLEDAFPPPEWPRLLPAETMARARARQLMSWIRTSAEALRRERTTDHIIFPVRAELPPLSPTAAQDARRLLEVADRLGAGPSGALFGAFSIADVDFAFMLMRLVASGAPVPAPVAAYTAAVWERPSVREFVAHPRPPNQP
jgi:glutathione S-transferase